LVWKIEGKVAKFSTTTFTCHSTSLFILCVQVTEQGLLECVRKLVPYHVYGEEKTKKSFSGVSPVGK